MTTRAALALALLAIVPAAGVATVRATPPAPLFLPAQKLAGADGGTEPRVTVGPDDRRWTITNSGGTAVVYGSADKGATWRLTAANPAGQTSPTIDVDIVATRAGRLIATELDGGGLNFPTSYSDDGGHTWTASSGLEKLADQDRQWLAVGPDDATTHQPRVYFLFHNLLSGAASHNMYVETSTDGGATFGPPVPTTLPGSQAWLDLQCADSGGPSGLAVDQHSGRVFAFFGTRSSAVGGCGASVTGPFEINVVGATRVWVVSSPDGSLGSWNQSIAVDDAAAGNIVGMQLSPGAVDSAGNVWVVYPESPNVYPDYTGAAIRVKWAPQDLGHWSAPITIAPQAQPGNLLAHIVAGDPGKIDVAWFAGQARGGGRTPQWYMTVAQVLDAMTQTPTVTVGRLSATPAYSGTASQMMGACGSGATQGIQNGFACNRSTDVWGIALDHAGNLIVSWPSLSTQRDPTLGAAVDATWVDTQAGGPTLFAAPGGTAGGSTVPAATSTGTSSGSGTSLANTSAGTRGGAPLAALVGLGVLAWLRALRRRRR